MIAWERRTRRDILTAVDQKAMVSSAEFVRAELGAAPPYFSKFDTLRAAMSAAPREGLYLEFGVASGGTLRVIVECAPGGSVFGFDSFEGLPEFWRPGFDAGAFKLDELPDVPGAELVPGWFDDTLPGFLEEHPEPVAFLHLDADLYSSTRTVLLALAPRLIEGTVIVFDEYFNFPGWEEHEHRAWVEFVAETGLRFEYLGYTADDEQVVVRLLNAPSTLAIRRSDRSGSRALVLAWSDRPPRARGRETPTGGSRGSGSPCRGRSRRRSTACRTRALS